MSEQQKIGDRLSEVQKDLRLLVNYFNQDDSTELATGAQNVLQTLVDFWNTLIEHGADDLTWPAE